MIKGVHAILFTPQADELRAFMRDKLSLPFVDTGGGWLIFKLAEAEVASHPAGERKHELSFYCDDIHQTVTELKQRGVEFTTDISEQNWGWLTHFKMPGGGEIELYQPKYSTEAASPA